MIVDPGIVVCCWLVAVMVGIDRSDPRKEMIRSGQAVSPLPHLFAHPLTPFLWLLRLHLI